MIELVEVNYSDSSIQQLIGELFDTKQSEIEKIQIAFQYVRDEK